MANEPNDPTYISPELRAWIEEAQPKIDPLEEECGCEVIDRIIHADNCLYPKALKEVRKFVNVANQNAIEREIFAEQLRTLREAAGRLADAADWVHKYRAADKGGPCDCRLCIAAKELHTLLDAKGEADDE